jgi:hypothetical protein
MGFGFCLERMDTAAAAEIDESEGVFTRGHGWRKRRCKAQCLSNQNLSLRPGYKNIRCHKELMFKEMAGAGDVGYGRASAPQRDCAAKRCYMARLQV